MATFNMVLLLGVLIKGGGPVSDYSMQARQWLVAPEGALRCLAVYAESNLPDISAKLVARGQEEACSEASRVGFARKGSL